MAVDKNEIAASYSFFLPVQKRVIIEDYWGSKPLAGTVIIINSTDTVITGINSKDIKKKAILPVGGEYRLTLTD